MSIVMRVMVQGRQVWGRARARHARQVLFSPMLFVFSYASGWAREGQGSADTACMAGRAYGEGMAGRASRASQSQAGLG